MRARQRHLTLNRNGASICLDARGLALSDGDAVGTFSDRSGNGKNATQATAGNKPTYKAAQCGGCPVVRFDGAASPNQDYLTVSSITIATPTFVAMWKATGGAEYLFDNVGGGTTRVSAGMSWNTGVQNGHLSIESALVNTAQEHNVDSRNEYMIYSGLFDGSSSLQRKNGKTVTTTPAQGTIGITSLTIGERFANYNNVSQLNGDIGALVIVASANASLRHRIELSLALSYKIACA